MGVTFVAAESRSAQTENISWIAGITSMCLLSGSNGTGPSIPAMASLQALTLTGTAMLA